MWQVAIAVIIIGTIFYFVNLGKNLDEEHVGLKFIFLMVSAWLMIAGIRLAQEFAISNGASSGVTNSINTFYLSAFWIVISLTAYMILYYIFNVMKMTNKSERKRFDFQFINNKGGGSS